MIAASLTLLMMAAAFVRISEHVRSVNAQSVPRGYYPYLASGLAAGGSPKALSVDASGNLLMSSGASTCISPAQNPPRGYYPSLMAALDSSGNPVYLTVDANCALNVTGAGGSPYDPAAVAITGGTINGTIFGGTTPAAGHFTTLSTTGALTLYPTASNNTILIAGGVEALYQAGGSYFVWGGGHSNNTFSNGLTVGSLTTTPANCLAVGTAGQFTVSGAGVITATPIKSTAGTRYLCIDSAGVISSSASACSGT